MAKRVTVAGAISDVRDILARLELMYNEDISGLVARIKGADAEQARLMAELEASRKEESARFYKDVEVRQLREKLLSAQVTLEAEKEISASLREQAVGAQERHCRLVDEAAAGADKVYNEHKDELALETHRAASFELKYCAEVDAHNTTEKTLQSVITSEEAAEEYFNKKVEKLTAEIARLQLLVNRGHEGITLRLPEEASRSVAISVLLRHLPHRTARECSLLAEGHAQLYPCDRKVDVEYPEGLAKFLFDEMKWAAADGDF